MNLHDPATERELLRLAKIGRAGKPMERKDPSGWTNVLWAHLTILGFAGGAFAMIFEKPVHWQFAFASVILVWLARILAGQIGSLRYDRLAVLLNLPVLGADILKWRRSRFFLGNWLAPPAFAAASALAIPLSGIHPVSTWQTALSAVLLAGTVFATAILLHENLFVRLRVVKLWDYTTVGIVIAAIALYFLHRRAFWFGGLSDWAAHGLLQLTWIFPPSWCLPYRFEHGGMWLALAWTGWGAARWISWPARVGPAFEEPQDLPIAFGDFEFPEDDEDDEEDEEIAETAEIQDFPETRDTDLPAPLAMPGEGWVDGWIRFVVGNRDAALAGAFTDPARTWTRQTNWVLLAIPFWFLVLWGFTKFYPDFEWKQRIVIWSCILSPVLLCAPLLPFSNALPRATRLWMMGQQQLLFFSAFPVSARDLLRISTKITLARCVVLVAVATPVLALAQWILNSPLSPWSAFWLVPAVACFWANSRPVFIYYRLQSATRRRAGPVALAIHLASGVALVILAIAWLAAGAIGVFSGLGFCAGDLEGNDFRLLPALALGGLLTSALCARAIFEIFHWKLRQRHFDWLTSG